MKWLDRLSRWWGIPRTAQPAANPAPAPAPKPAEEQGKLPEWRLTVAGRLSWAWGRTKSEARADAKRRLGFKARLPAGTRLERTGRTSTPEGT